MLRVGAGDVFVTPKGSKGTWHVHETVAKFFAIYTGGAIGDTTMRVIGANEPVEWITLENEPGDENPPGQEWYAWRNPDARFSTGVWRREPETGTFDREYHEVACLIEGDVEIETDDGRVLRAGAGDVHRHAGRLERAVARADAGQEVLGGPSRVARTARWIPSSGRGRSRSWWRPAPRPSCSVGCASAVPAAASAASSDRGST